MTEHEHNHDEDRQRAEEPAEGAVQPGGTTPDREHTQDPAEGADPEDDRQH